MIKLNSLRGFPIPFHQPFGQCCAHLRIRVSISTTYLYHLHGSTLKYLKHFNPVSLSDLTTIDIFEHGFQLKLLLPPLMQTTVSKGDENQFA